VNIRNDDYPMITSIGEDPVKTNPEDERMRDALTDWWIERARAEVEAVAPKAVEYSAVDLIEVGRTFALVMDLGPRSDVEYAEIGIWAYIIGKMGRWTGAIKEGRRVSDDTIHDIGIYVKMAQRNRDVGGWPFAPEEEL
jgi:hypothetical protein